MKEIGGYIELDRYTLPMLHDNAVKLNCGRNALAYLIQSRNINKIKLPKFLCDSVKGVCVKYGVEMSFYHIDENFLPCDIQLEKDEWLYLVNYYGQLDNDAIKHCKETYDRVILDHAQAYFQMPVSGVDTLYTCRKFFGVADGAILYTDCLLKECLEQDESYQRMNYLLGRFERTASEFYQEYAENNDMFAQEPMKQMSKLTENLLHGIDYAFVQQRRTSNFQRLHEQLEKHNQLSLNIPQGAFMYPFYTQKAQEIRKQLQQQKIYIPTLWPEVLQQCSEDSLEYQFTKNILPLPVDQRYTWDDMDSMASKIMQLLQ